MYRKFLWIVPCISICLGAGILAFYFWQAKQVKILYGQITAQEVEVHGLDYVKEVLNCEDVVAYLSFPSLGYGYPVLLGETNEFYLSHAPDGSENSHGSIFLDVSCSPDFDDSTSLIYGHNMRDKTMFGWLEDTYGNGATGDTFLIYTKDSIRTYQLLCTSITPGYGESVYLLWEGAHLADVFSRLMERATWWDTSVSYEDTSKIVTLLTCEKDRKKRFAVTGILTEVKDY